MKLYTEEQMLKVWKADQEYWKTSGASITLEELLEHETPIELPSDEEIYEAGKGHCTFLPSFVYGAQWMRDKIQGDNQ
jgi:hypothetical protein